MPEMAIIVYPIHLELYIITLLKASPQPKVGAPFAMVQIPSSFPQQLLGKFTFGR